MALIERRRKPAQPTYRNPTPGPQAAEAVPEPGEAAAKIRRRLQALGLEGMLDQIDVLLGQAGRSVSQWRLHPEDDAAPDHLAEARLAWLAIGEALTLLEERNGDMAG